MQIEVKRKVFSDHSTIGQMWIDKEFACFTLEDVVRPEKIYGETAIPAGTYEVVITFSNRFRRDMPLLKDVKGFEGIRIHAGNTHRDTHGCILVGLTMGTDKVLQSRDAYKLVFGKIQAAIVKGETVTLTAF